jgi:formylglycine-generating enzyme required for sulfatase activity
MSAAQSIPIYTCHHHTARYFIEKLPNLAPDDIELKMVEIPAGSFMMGAPETEAESSNSERPQYQVSVPAFWMGKYQVTQAQWQIVAGMPQIERKLEPERSSFKVNNHPVDRVSWLEVVEFCKRLSLYTGREYRLPSEAEWEYGCRAGTVTPFHYGETITTELVNYDGNQPYGEAPKGEYRGKTTPVGKFPANSFGLHDMHGNVWEWCEDDWHYSYNDVPIEERAWIDNNNNRSQEEVRKVLRGGSWFNSARSCRSAYRDSYEARIQGYTCGFRVVCSSVRTSSFA